MVFKSCGSGGRFVSKGSGGGFKAKVLTSGIPTIDTNGLVLYLDAGNSASYPGSGTTWLDLSGQGNHSSILQAGFGFDPTPIYDPANGGSIGFGGVNRYAPTSMTAFPSGNAPGTLSAWAKTATIGGSWSWIFAYGAQSASGARFLGINGSNYYFGGYGNDINASGVPLDTWFNMVGVYDGSAASMYVNGILVSGPTAKSWNTSNVSSAVGRQVSGSEYWNGNVAQVLVYDRALTAGEILQNFDADKARFGL